MNKFILYLGRKITNFMWLNVVFIGVASFFKVKYESKELMILFSLLYIFSSMMFRFPIEHVFNMFQDGFKYLGLHKISESMYFCWNVIFQVVILAILDAKIYCIEMNLSQIIICAMYIVASFDIYMKMKARVYNVVMERVE